MAEISNEQLAQAVTSPRFAALAQTGRAVGDVHHWDRRLLREPRLLVPVDVQALVVRDADEPMVRLPFRQADDVVAPIDDPGEKRPPGVHLLWTTPAAFGRGKVVDDPAAPGDKGRRILELPVLPDRWVVVRIAILAADWEPLVRGWVLEADTATVIPLADYPTRTNATTVGPAVPADRLTVHVGGPTWTSCYDAALGRHAFHDNLDELADLATAGLIGDAITYVVAGWWSDPRRDPLDGVGSIIGYHRRLQELGWDDPDHPLSDAQASTSQRSERSVASIFGLDVGGRYSRAQWAGFDLYPNTSSFVHEAIEAAVAPAAPTRSTMLHGRIHGVPWKSLHRPDDRPAPSQVKVALGPTGPAVSAVVASGALTNGNAQLQRDAERLLTAFSSGLIDRIENPDAWPDIEQYEHAQGFASQPGGVDAVDHLVDRPNRGNDPGASFRRGRRTKLPGAMIDLAATILWSAEKPPMILPVKKAATTARAAGGPGVSASMNKPPSSAAAANLGLKEVARNVERPAPPYHTPIAPVFAVVGAGRRLLAAERDESDGVLRVRTSDQPVRGMSGLLKADALLRSLGSGAIPDEVVTVAREALAEDPYLTSWRSQIATADVPSGASVDLRIRAEAAINYAYYAGDDERLSTCVGVGVDSSQTRQAAVEGLLKHSLVDGVWSHPEGVTMWGQPWRPLFCEWSVDLDLAGLVTLGDWTLEEIDLEREASFPGGEVITLTGRSPLVTSAASTLAAAVERWITDERARDKLGHGLASGAVEKAMVGLRNHLADLDVLSVTIDGVRESLLGLQYDRGLVRATVDAGPGGAPRALAIALPRLVAAGRLTLTSARLVDCFGRTLELPVAATVVAARAVDTATTAALQLRPRINAPARLHLRLVDPLAVSGAATTAFVDQADPSHQVNPVAGFLLPDHIDEALEIFAADGTPLGQVSHDPFSDAVFWEGAPGRTDIGPAAGPLDDPDSARQRLGWIASALVRVDAAARQATPNRPETESPLSALLRAIDTTLWTVDPLGSMGREHIAGLVGRPIAVVTAHLTLDVLPDLDELVYGAATTREEREQVYAELAAVPFAVRLGCTTRSDDGLLGYFLDDDYTKFHVIDRVITTQARDTGRCRGDLGVQAQAGTLAIEHPYVVPGGTVTIRHGQTLRLTLLMHPGAKVHLTSGVLPRSSIVLARDWVQPGLSVMAPSVRCGPLLIDADKVRLPKVASFPAEQLWTRRDAPGSWRDDPILAATQSAYLPDEASEVQEGWIRIAPTTEEGD